MFNACFHKKISFLLSERSCSQLLLFTPNWTTCIQSHLAFFHTQMQCCHDDYTNLLYMCCYETLKSMLDFLDILKPILQSLKMKIAPKTRGNLDHEGLTLYIIELQQGLAEFKSINEFTQPHHASVILNHKSR